MIKYYYLQTWFNSGKHERITAEITCGYTFCIITDKFGEYFIGRLLGSGKLYVGGKYLA